MWSRIMKVPSERFSSEGSKNEYTIDSPSLSTSVSATAIRSPPRPLTPLSTSRRRYSTMRLSTWLSSLHHHRVIEHGHVGHAAVAMALVEIGPEYRILLGGRHRAALFADDVGVARQNLPEIARGPELVGDDAHGHAGAALVAGRAVGDRLAAPEIG